jgi:Ni/Co efflux regulator RcnB
LSKFKFWIWVRVPLQALLTAIDALRERSERKHLQAMAEKDEEARTLLRADADRDAEHLKDLRTGHHKWEQGDEPPSGSMR